ncbi:MAG: hypothetical protein LBU18_02380 [Treponema sp.]|jgi:hypothetical protein|nr:hypothetical protein [Treponema sp.]
MENKKGMAYLLVGKGKHWGKSRTLRALTDGDFRMACINIVSKKDGNAYEFYIRRTSNTDIPERFEQFIRDADYENIIIAFSIGDPDAQKMLSLLSSHYRLRCFVLRHR